MNFTEKKGLDPVLGFSNKNNKKSCVNLVKSNGFGLRGWMVNKG